MATRISIYRKAQKPVKPGKLKRRPIVNTTLTDDDIAEDVDNLRVIEEDPELDEKMTDANFRHKANIIAGLVPMTVTTDDYIDGHPQLKNFDTVGVRNVRRAPHGRDMKPTLVTSHFIKQLPAEPRMVCIMALIPVGDIPRNMVIALDLNEKIGYDDP